MDEIRALQKRLADAVAGASTARLSERNIVELVEKLKQLGLLDDILFTTDGKEYITRKQVRLELGDELLLAGGRLPLTDAVLSLNLDLPHIEQAASDMVKKSGRRGDIALVGGALITSYYLDGICEEINELLIEAGQISLNTLAKMFGFTSDYLRQAIEPRLDTIILGKLDSDDTLYTQAYIERITAQISGAINGVTWPSKVSQIRQTCGLGQEPRFFSTFDELLNSGQLPGSIQGRIERATYTPTLFGQSQKAWIDAAFRRDGYLEYSLLDKLKVKNVETFVKNQFGDLGVALDSMFVSHHIVQSVTASVHDVSEDVLDVMTVIPFPITDTDAKILLDLCIDDNDDAIAIGDSFVVGVPLLNSLKNKCETWVQEQVRQAPTQLPKRPEPETVSKKPRRRARKDKIAVSEPVRPFSDLSLDLIARQLASWDSALNSEEDEVLEAIAELLLPHAIEMRDEAVKAIHVAEAQWRRKRRQFILDNIQTVIVGLSCHLTAAHGDDTLIRHLRRTDGVVVLDSIVTLLAMDEGIDEEDRDVTRIPQLSDSDRLRIMKVLPQRGVVETITNVVMRDDGDLLQSIISTCDELSIFVPNIDKKRTKTYMADWKSAMTHSIKKSDQPAELLLAVVTLLYSEVHGGALSITVRHIKNILEKITDRLDPADASFLRSYQHMVGISLGDEEDRRLEGEMMAGMDKLRTIGLKDMQ